MRLKIQTISITHCLENLKKNKKTKKVLNRKRANQMQSGVNFGEVD